MLFDILDFRIAQDWYRSIWEGEGDGTDTWHQTKPKTKQKNQITDLGADGQGGIHANAMEMQGFAVAATSQITL